jgi:protein-arginine deiminase
VLGYEYIASNPFGPIIKGRDVFADAVMDVYARANMTVHFIDDYMSHHVRGGEVHCATNSLRDASIPWVAVAL